MSLSRILKKELTAQLVGIPCDKILFYQGVKQHYCDYPIIAKSYGTAQLFSSAKPYIYDSDQIAGSIRGIVSSEYDERLHNHAEKVVSSYGTNGFVTNSDHFAPNYRTFLKDGIPGTYLKIESSKKTHTDEKSQRFLSAMKITLDGFCSMIENYADAAEKKSAEAANPEPAQRFIVMSSDLRVLLKEAPKTFSQALQLMFLCHVAFVLQGKYAMAFGRLDQFLWPYYQTDLKKGILTREIATELLTGVFLKIGEHRYIGGDDVVNICIGGITPDGADAVNELSYCILDAVRIANIPGPNLSARLHNAMPEKFLDEAMKVIATGLGYPALMNDSVNIPALLRHGYEEQDVNDYCFVGCIENFIPGKQPPWSDGRFNVPMYFEPLMFGGVTLRNPDHIGPDTGSLASLKTMEDFLHAFHLQLEYGISEYFMFFNNENDRYNNENYAQPFLSIFCEDCIGRARDILDGGAKYPSAHGAGCIGIATVADSLAAVEKFIYNEKKYTLEQLAQAIKADFKGFEKMRDDLKSAPKYGNDDDFVDKYAVWYVEEMERLVSSYKTRDGGPVYSAIASNVQNISAGEEVAATPDGRGSGEPLSDAASPMHGMDHEGITAVIKSTTKPDYRLVSCGTVLNQKFAPKMLNDDDCRKKVCDLIRVYFKMGGQEIQINSVSRDMLKDAMKHPENYQNLVVRVSGFSAYFVNLDRSVQLDILKRTEHDDTES